MTCTLVCGQALKHREAALRLVEHWKGEAERQAQFAQVGDQQQTYIPWEESTHSCFD